MQMDFVYFLYYDIFCHKNKWALSLVTCMIVHPTAQVLTLDITDLNNLN